jgi:hypothetical protein
MPTELAEYNAEDSEHFCVARVQQQNFPASAFSL